MNSWCFSGFTQPKDIGSIVKIVKTTATLIYFWIRKNYTAKYPNDLGPRKIHLYRTGLTVAPLR